MADASGEYQLATEEQLKSFVATVLERTGVARDDADVVAGVLTAADLRGIESHGVARLNSFYVSRLRGGNINAKPRYRIVRETPTTFVMDADNGLGHPAAKCAMQRVIDKALANGCAFAAVRNSNHYGIAGYYAMMALEHDLIGISSTNSVRYGAPTFGSEPLLGTNPFAFAVPAGREPPFVLDFATTTVPRGRLEVYKRKELPLSEGWAIDASGAMTRDPARAMAGALLPLGGYGTEHGGHKGYGLGLLSDILCGVLSGGAFGLGLPDLRRPADGGICHWFGAIRIDGFRDAAEFKADVDRELRFFKESRKVPGQDRIFVAGEPEHERTLRNRASGIPVHRKVWAELRNLAGELGVPFELGR